MSYRLTRLESAIMDALAYELRHLAPDLAGQVEDSRPERRRNTGAGLFTELILDRDRPAPRTTPTGRFGTVHAMVGDLVDPIAFQVELREGRLIGLHGDSYDQDTRAIDFATAPFDQVFTLNDQGESIAFDPAAIMRHSPLLDLHQHSDQDPPPWTLIDPPLVKLGVLHRVEDSESDRWPEDPVETDEAEPEEAETTSLLIGLWVSIAALAFLAVVIFRVPLFLAFFIAIMAGRALKQSSVLAAVTRLAHRLGQYEYRQR